MKSPIEMLEHWVATQGDKVYLKQPINGQYKEFTWKEVYSQVQQLAGGLRHLGLVPGDKIAILSKNCAEWFITDLALMYAGYISVPIYPTANADTIRYTLEHSDSKAVIVGKLDNWPEQETGVNGDILRLSMPYDTMPAQYQWEQLLSLGQPLKDTPLPTSDTMMTIVYTSGSTGKPKGVMHHFSNYAWTAQAAAKKINLSTDDRIISYLPLAHITERVILEGSSIYSGFSVAFVENMSTFVDDVKRARPTLFFSVPRLWSLFQKNIIDKIGANKLNLLLKIPIINTLIKNKIKAGLGFSDCQKFGSGSAPIPPSLIAWYHSIDIDICEGWGMTENSVFSLVHLPFNPNKIGSVGQPIEGCSIKQSETGELLVKSPGLMQGYYKNEELTQVSFTDEGYYLTGDLCTIDDDGYVFITGRVKDNFKTSKGKYVAPVPIETKLAKDLSIEQICIIGSGLPHPIALVQLSEGAKLQHREEVRTSLKETLDNVNTHLESHEKVDAIVITDEVWSVDNDILTPTLKIKRHVIEARYINRLEDLRGGQIRWENEL
ncbi:AMP-binding protein [Shewanella surugensis]|uniref:AMP-binding protein n=1 Tax=Shewanella surugensis TaxID=212020 RepID=A0ABT0LAE5_9GAMM|nr:AMP-binding protein [Shewanella surugensis]MCL1124610.1 AMP-binding protein [Shewanella surugensis]